MQSRFITLSLVRRWAGWRTGPSPPLPAGERDGSGGSEAATEWITSPQPSPEEEKGRAVSRFITLGEGPEGHYHPLLEERVRAGAKPEAGWITIPTLSQREAGRAYHPLW